MAEQRKAEISLLGQGSPLPIGIHNKNNIFYFSVSIHGVKECILKIFKKGKDIPELEIKLGKINQIGSLFFTAVKIESNSPYEYLYEADGKTFIDPYARKINGRDSFGKKVKLEDNKNVRASISRKEYDWEGDLPLETGYEDLIIYRLHIRGFTKDISSKVKQRGTFSGVTEKIPYLKSLGITAVELLPCYEFNEIIEQKPLDLRFAKPEDDNQEYKVNYWGYAQENYYFAPKASYAGNPQEAEAELKDMVKALHKNQIEVIMEFYFTPKTSQQLILDCLRYWVMEYHIDGFKINLNVVDDKLAAADPVLNHTKLFGTYWDLKGNHVESSKKMIKNLADYNDGFMIAMRQFLKGDEGQVKNAAEHFRHNPAGKGIIHYITNTNGFTLNDLVSYDIKHNEENGEKGTDGTDFNYSWNCGAEGKTRKKKILELREKQMKNAVLFLFFSQGSPLLLAGDEFGNSQRGNNNPYCQDNKLSWLDWRQLETNRTFYEFVKECIEIRKKHPILHMKEELRCTDYASCGFPDLSYHGTKAWYPDYLSSSRILGVMFCGKYAMNQEKKDDYFYLAVNMHWEKHAFDLPKLPHDVVWEILLCTSKLPEEPDIIVNKKVMIPSRSIILFIGRAELEKSVVKKEQRKKHDKFYTKNNSSNNNVN